VTIDAERRIAIEHVTSTDGTRIAYERSGSGPPLVLVHGSINDHGIWAAVTPALAQHFTVLALDRRGRGESGEPREHEMQRQFEDVLAVVDAADGPVDLVGHSFGAHCALGAAAMSPERIRHLVLYEPPPVDDVRSAVAEAFERQEPSDAVANFMEHNLVMPREQVDALRQTPFWDYLVSFAPTMPSEGRALMRHGFDASHYALLTMPALFLQGSVTADRLGKVMRELEPHMPHAEWHTFEGQGHGAMLTAAPAFAETVLAFLRR
jgi:pimeloyl-ACP methyl ester carboxylesterase